MDSSALHVRRGSASTPSSPSVVPPSSLHDRSTLSLPRGPSESGPPTPSFDVQICINDVTVVDDVSVTSDTDSCRSGSESVARLQRRRLSWCPERSDDAADKQRLLSVSGRRYHDLVLLYAGVESTRFPSIFGPHACHLERLKAGRPTASHLVSQHAPGVLAPAHGRNGRFGVGAEGGCHLLQWGFWSDDVIPRIYKNSSGDEIANVNFLRSLPGSYPNSLKNAKITPLRRSRSFKVTDFGTNRKLI